MEEVLTRKNEALTQLVGEFTALQAESTNVQTAPNQFKVLKAETVFNSQPHRTPFTLCFPALSRENHCTPKLPGGWLQATRRALAASKRLAELPVAAAAAAETRCVAVRV